MRRQGWIYRESVNVGLGIGSTSKWEDGHAKGEVFIDVR